jgi:HAE1 family hydrophobic/amphiphilic exporter-1
MESFSLVTLQLKAGTNVDIALQDAQRKVNAVRADFPENVEEPSLSDFDINDIPIMTVGATAQMDETAFFNLMDREVKPALERIPGIARINLIGGQEREIQVNVNAERMNAYGLSISAVCEMLESSNLDFPAGKVKNDDEQILIRLQGKYQNTNDIGNVTLLAAPDGTTVKLRDIAEVADTYREPATLSRVNGIPSIGITVQRSSDANAVAVSEAVLSVIEKEKAQHQAQRLDFVVAANSSEFTKEASASVMKDMMIAIA